MEFSHDSGARRLQAASSTNRGPLVFVIGLVTGLLFALVTDRITQTDADRDIELIRAVRNLAVEDFVVEVESKALADDALRGMLEGLDKYSSFYGSEDIAKVDRETSGEFRGIGVVFRQPTQAGQVLFPLPDSPATRAGMRVGDRLLKVAGLEVADMAPGGLQETIQTMKGPTLDVLVEGLDSKQRNLTLELMSIVDPTVRHTRILDAQLGIGYLAILSFSHRTPDELDRAIRGLQENGLKRLIVDLRFNPGGILEAAVKIANRFIPEGIIVSTRTRTETHVTKAEETEAHFAGLPLVLLVDEGSASASEVLAGALQDHCIAALVGDATYGKGTVQTLRQLSGQRGIIKLTTAYYYTPSARRIEREENSEEAAGIAPEVLVKLGESERWVIRNFLRTYSAPPASRAAIRAWEQSEGIELLKKHPQDRQLDAAVALLSGRTRNSELQQAH